MPDEVSNTGADWVTNDFGNDLKTLNDKAAELIPTGYITYPLKQEEERFPFISLQAKSFEPAGLNQAKPYTAGIEGVAYVERYVSALSGKEVKAVFTAGGVSNSEAWLTNYK